MPPVSGGGRIAESAKARVRRASLLRNEDYKRLLEQTSVSDIAVQLKNSSYAAILEGFTLENMRRADLEFLLDAAILMEGVAFRHYMGTDDRKLLDLWLENFDIELFKNHIRVRLGTGEWGRSDSKKLTELVSDFHLTLLDQEKLFAANGLKDTLAALKNEPLRASLAEALPQGRDSAEIGVGDADFQKTTFAMGMILDRHYFNSLYSAVSGLGGNEGRMMRTMVGTRVDLMNLYWIYRMRRYFGMSPEEALTTITKVRYRVDFELLTKAAFADPATFPAVLKDTAYAWVFEVEQTDPSMREVALERNLYKALFDVVNRVFLSGTQGFQNVAAYLMLKEFEVRDLIAIVEGVRYDFDRSKVDLILIRPLDDGITNSTSTKSGV